MIMIDVFTGEKYTMLDSCKDYRENPFHADLPSTFAEEWAHEIEWTMRGVNDFDIAGLTYEEAHRVLDRIYNKLEKEGKM